MPFHDAFSVVTPRFVVSMMCYCMFHLRWLVSVLAVAICAISFRHPSTGALHLPISCIPQHHILLLTIVSPHFMGYCVPGLGSYWISISAVVILHSGIGLHWRLPLNFNWLVNKRAYLESCLDGIWELAPELTCFCAVLNIFIITRNQKEWIRAQENHH